MRYNGRYTGINRYLLDDNGWPMRSSEILKYFWIKPGHRIPANLSVARHINGVLVTIRPKTKKGMEKRVFATCPECGRSIEAGHLHQHVEAFHMAR